MIVVEIAYDCVHLTTIVAKCSIVLLECFDCIRLLDLLLGILCFDRFVVHLLDLIGCGDLFMLEHASRIKECRNDSDSSEHDNERKDRLVRAVNLFFFFGGWMKVFASSLAEATTLPSSETIFA